MGLAGESHACAGSHVRIPAPIGSASDTSTSKAVHCCAFTRRSSAGSRTGEPGMASSVCPPWLCAGDGSSPGRHGAEGGRRSVLDVAQGMGLPSRCYGARRAEVISAPTCFPQPDGGCVAAMPKSSRPRDFLYLVRICLKRCIR